jgi:hypothetical protein
MTDAADNTVSKPWRVEFFVGGQYNGACYVLAETATEARSQALQSGLYERLVQLAIGVQKRLTTSVMSVSAREYLARVSVPSYV